MSPAEIYAAIRGIRSELADWLLHPDDEHRRSVDIDATVLWDHPTAWRTRHWDLHPLRPVERSWAGLLGRDLSPLASVLVGNASPLTNIVSSLRRLRDGLAERREPQSDGGFRRATRQLFESFLLRAWVSGIDALEVRLWGSSDEDCSYNAFDCHFPTADYPRAALQELVEAAGDFLARATSPSATHTDPQSDTPRLRWDKSRRRLYVGDVVVLAYQKSSPAQEAVLDAIDSQRWPVDAYVPVPFDHDPKQMSKTVCRLNKRLAAGTGMSFASSGTSVKWTLGDRERGSKRD